MPVFRGVITLLAQVGGIAEPPLADGIPNMKKPKNNTGLEPHIHISREDRARTNAGKTVNSKVRSEGRTLAALERNALAARTLAAEEAKQLPSCE